MSFVPLNPVAMFLLRSTRSQADVGSFIILVQREGRRLETGRNPPSFYSSKITARGGRPLAFRLPCSRP